MSPFPPSLKPNILRKLESVPSSSVSVHHNSNQSIFDQSEVQNRVDEWFSKLSDDDKINQLFCLTLSPDSIQYAKSNMIGSFLVDGNYTAYSRPGNFLLTVGDWAKHMSEEVLPIVQEKYGIPTLYGIDSVHGCNHVVGKVIFPHNINIGKVYEVIKTIASSPQTYNSIFEGISRQLGYYTAFESQKIGFNWIFSPCVAIASNHHWGRTYESVSLDSEVVKIFSKAYVDGCQQISKKTSSSERFISGALCSVKHYLGDGATMHGEDQGISPLPQEPLQRDKNHKVQTKQGEEEEKLKESVREFFHNNEAGYVGGIEADAGNVMISYSKVSFHYDHYTRKQVVPMHLNKPFIDRLFSPKSSKFNSSSSFPSLVLSNACQTEGLGFKGFTVSDYDAANGISKFYTQNPSYEPENGKYNLQDYRQVMFHTVMSGVDQLMMSPASFLENYDPKTNTFNLVQLIRENVPQHVIDTAVRRVLTVKATMASPENKTVPLLKQTVLAVDSQPESPTIEVESQDHHLPSNVVEDLEGLKEQVELSYLIALLSCTVQSQNGVLFPQYATFPIIRPSFFPSSNEKTHLLLLGREAQPNPSVPGKPFWNAFYDDLGIQCGGWTLSWQGVAGYFTPKSDEFQQYEVNVNHYWRHLLHRTLKISFPLPTPPPSPVPLSPVVSQQPSNVLSSDLGDFYLVDSVSPRHEPSPEPQQQPPPPPPQPKYEEVEIGYASTVLSSLTRHGVKPVVVSLQSSPGHLSNLQSHYNQTNSQALIVLGEFPYAEMLGDIHTHSAIWWDAHAAMNPWAPEKQLMTTLNVQLRLQETTTKASVPPNVSVSPQVGRANAATQQEHDQLEAVVGSKLSISTFKSLYFAYSQKIETTAVVISGRELNISVPLLSAHSIQLLKDHPHLQKEFCHPFGDDRLEDLFNFGKLALKDVCKSVVWAGLPGTNGGDAILNFVTAS